MHHIYMWSSRLIEILDEALPVAVYRWLAQKWAFRQASRILDSFGERSHMTRAAVQRLVQADLARIYGRQVSQEIRQLLRSAEKYGAVRNDLRLVVSAGLLRTDVLSSEIRYGRAEKVFDYIATLGTLTISHGLLALVLCVPSTVTVKTCASASALLVVAYCVTWSSSLTWRAQRAFRRVVPALLKARSATVVAERGNNVHRFREKSQLK